MKRKFAVISLLLAALVPLQASAADVSAGAVVAKSADNKKIAEVDTIKVLADVIAIDAATREVTLKTARGDDVVVVAGPEVRNFAQIKVGDRLVVQYIESMVAEIKKGTAGIRERIEGSDSARAPAGGKPGVASARQVTVLADVIAVDAKRRDVTLKGATRTVTLHVKDKAVFSNIKVGDQIAATFTQAVAIAIEPVK